MFTFFIFVRICLYSTPWSSLTCHCKIPTFSRTYIFIPGVCSSFSRYFSWGATTVESQSHSRQSLPTCPKSHARSARATSRKTCRPGDVTVRVSTGVTLAVVVGSQPQKWGDTVPSWVSWMYEIVFRMWPQYETCIQYIEDPFVFWNLNL